MQTVVKMPPEAPEEIVEVLIIFCDKSSALGSTNYTVKTFSGFYLHHVKIFLYVVDGKRQGETREMGWGKRERCDREYKCLLVSCCEDRIWTFIPDLGLGPSD